MSSGMPCAALISGFYSRKECLVIPYEMESLAVESNKC